MLPLAECHKVGCFPLYFLHLLLIPLRSAAHSQLIKFADDMCVLHFVRTISDDQLQLELDNISSWSNEHGLKLNTQKTKLMDINTKRRLTLQPLVDNMNNCVIENVSSAKLLGLTIDENLSWQPHVDFIMSKLRKRTYFLHALRRAKAPNSVLSTVYCQMLRSVSSYAFPAWCNITSGRFNSIAKFEKRVFKLFNFSCKNSFNNFCNISAQRLALRALDPRHPLHCVFDFSASRYSSRKGRRHRKLLARTSRFKNSFISYT